MQNYLSGDRWATFSLGKKILRLWQRISKFILEDTWPSTLITGLLNGDNMLITQTRLPCDGEIHKH